jgi:3-oxoadipate enol-lactonase
MVAPGTPAGPMQAAQSVMAAVPEQTYRQVLAAIVAFDRRGDLPAIGVPTLCLAGAHDRTAPPEVMRRMAGHIPGAEFVELSGAGHIANVEQPQAFGDAVVGFLRRHLTA